MEEFVVAKAGGPPPWMERGTTPSPQMQEALKDQERRAQLQERIVEAQMPPPLEARMRADAVQWAIAFAEGREVSVNGLIQTAQQIWDFVRGADGEMEERAGQLRLEGLEFSNRAGSVIRDIKGDK